MSGWSTVFQTLHSCLIDELTDRYPDPQPVLGLPRKFPGFCMPHGAEHPELWYAPLSLDGKQAWFILATQSRTRENFPRSWNEFWASLLKTIEHEKGIRKQAFEVGKPQPMETPPEVTQLIWVPFALGGGTCFMGMGI
jgi:hypothetical protein